MIVDAIVDAASSSGISATNERSIFSRSTGIRQSRERARVARAEVIDLAIRKPFSLSPSSTAAGCAPDRPSRSTR